MNVQVKTRKLGVRFVSKKPKQTPLSPLSPSPLPQLQQWYNNDNNSTFGGIDYLSAKKNNTNN